jgi:hypothetical protein
VRIESESMRWMAERWRFQTGTPIAIEYLPGRGNRSRHARRDRPTRWPSPLEHHMFNLSSRRVVRTAGVISSVALLALFLALKDISHGEADVTLEWLIVQVSLGIILVYHVLSVRLQWRGEMNRS